MQTIAKQAPSAPPRTLKIEEAGDPYKGGPKPKIRLTGNWLKRAGFNPGERVEVTFLETGKINLAVVKAPSQGRSQIPHPSDLQNGLIFHGVSHQSLPSIKQLNREQGGLR